MKNDKRGVSSKAEGQSEFAAATLFCWSFDCATDALGRYNSGHNSDFRVGGPYGGRGYPDPGFNGENGYGRGGFHRDMLVDRDRYQMAPPLLGAWPPARGNAYDDEIGVIRGPQRHAYRDAHGPREAGDYRDANTLREGERFDNFRERDNFGDHEFERGGRFFDAHRQGPDGDDYSYKRSSVKGSREGSWDRDYSHSRYDDAYESEHEKDRKDRNLRKVRRRDREKQRSKERDESPERGRHRERSWSHSRSRSQSRSRSRSRSRSHGTHDYHSRKSRSTSQGYVRDKRERSHEDAMHSSLNDRRRTRDDRRHRDYNNVAPSATLVVKGLSQRTIEEDIYQALVEWGPLRHVRVIKERSTGTSRGFAFVDFPSVDAARKMMDDVGDTGLVVDGRRLFFEYSSKPTGGVGGPQADVGATNGSITASAVDWMCLVCGCVNFARRTSCFQCNEGRTDDAPPADVSTVVPSALGKKGSEAGPTHVLVVRGLDENVNEEILHYEFSKYAPLKDLRLVRDKFTHISKGFAFAHFHSVEDATKALEASNGTTLDKNGQPLRVAYAKSTYGPGLSSSSNMQASNSLAAAAIEAATFAQQYDAVGWAPKEYNPDQSKDGGATEGGVAETNAAPQAGFVWDEASGYYYDAASGFYYDGHRGLYYDGNHGVWYTYNQETQQYEPYAGQEVDASNTHVTARTKDAATNQQSASFKANTTVKSKDATTIRKAVISAPPSTTSVEHDAKGGLAEAVKAAATAANASMKKEKSRKALLPSSKTKIGGMAAMWKQNKEGTQLDQSTSKTSLNDEKSKSTPTKAAAATIASGASITPTAVPKKIQGVIHTKQTVNKAAPEEALLASYTPAKTSGFGTPAATKKLEGVIRSRDELGGMGMAKKFEGVIHSRDEMGGFGGAISAKKLEGVIRSKDVTGFSSQVVGNAFSGGYSSESTGRARHEDAVLKKVDAPVATGGRRRFTEAPSGRL
ncbi:hypothetical protein GOP47_0015799 [Adiantum capillus-veneris]|uniref:SUPPRESSOR OF ABI3-5 n=1 Tax=Adiantum capillus-veneris TaxID=13818 RepID=A0A9D4ULH9_ADICA|nr:hypothetical protein GOP47_0015799 [Adiantum capillus-veneris]